MIGWIRAMFATAKHRFTVEEYYRMAETRVLRPDRICVGAGNVVLYAH